MFIYRLFYLLPNSLNMETVAVENDVKLISLFLFHLLQYVVQSRGRNEH